MPRQRVGLQRSTGGSRSSAPPSGLPGADPRMGKLAFKSGTPDAGVMFIKARDRAAELAYGDYSSEMSLLILKGTAPDWAADDYEPVERSARPGRDATQADIEDYKIEVQEHKAQKRKWEKDKRSAFGFLILHCYGDTKVRLQADGLLTTLQQEVDVA